MTWSWTIGRVAGIPVRVHWTFVILIVWLVAEGASSGGDVWKGLEQAGFVLALFGCVVLHEFGHALTARRFGVPTDDVTLLPIGGVARLRRIPEQPGQELLIALAGPAVNLAIVAGLWLAGVRLPDSIGDSHEILRAGPWSKILLLNGFLAGFNMLPAFPMDGGRVLRALLAMRFAYARATRAAATIGQIMAIAFGLIGLNGGAPLLLLVALFVWIGAEAEAEQVERRAALKGVSVRDAMLTDFHALRPDDSLGRAVELLLAGSQHDFPVEAVGDEEPRVLTRADLMTGLAARGADARVAEFAVEAVPVVEADTPLIAAVNGLRKRRAACALVVHQGREVGLLTLENVAELLMIRAALGKTGDGTIARSEGEPVY